MGRLADGERKIFTNLVKNKIQGSTIDCVLFEEKSAQHLYE